jgi:erythromycin esterase-like protein
MDETGLGSEAAWDVITSWVYDCATNPEDIWHNEAISEYIQWLKARNETI